VSGIDLHRCGTVLLGLALLGCSGGDDLDCKAVAAMGLPPATARVVSLSGPQRNQVCDATACANGGYGVQHACPNGPSVTFAGSRDECLGQWTTNRECHATVQDLMKCMAAIKASPCVGTFLGSADCEAVTQFECLTFKPNAASPGMAGIVGSGR
jgi:hypothetical protein